MLTRLGRFSVAHRKGVLVSTALLAIVAAVLGGGVAKRLTTGGFYDPGSESQRAAQLLEQRFAQAPPNLVLLVTPRAARSVDDPAVTAAGLAFTRRVAGERYVRNVASYWTLDAAAPLRAHNGRSALVLATISGNDDQVNDRVQTVARDLTASNPNRVL